MHLAADLGVLEALKQGEGHHAAHRAVKGSIGGVDPGHGADADPGKGAHIVGVQGRHHRGHYLPVHSSQLLWGRGGGAL